MMNPIGRPQTCNARPYKITNKKVGHIINVFSFVMCPIFFHFMIYNLQAI